MKFSDINSVSRKGVVPKEAWGRGVKCALLVNKETRKVGKKLLLKRQKKQHEKNGSIVRCSSIR